jgi:hypothetical protein
LYRRLLLVLGTRVWAHFWAQSAGFSLGLFRKTEGKRDKATVFLTVAFFDESRRHTRCLMQPSGEVAELAERMFKNTLQVCATDVRRL